MQPKRQNTAPKTRVVVREREDESEKEISAIVKVIFSLISLLVAGFIAFGTGINSISQGVIFSVAVALGFGGLVSIFKGSATLVYGGAKITGTIAVLIFVLLLVLGGLRIIDFPPGARGRQALLTSELALG